MRIYRQRAGQGPLLMLLVVNKDEVGQDPQDVPPPLPGALWWWPPVSAVLDLITRAGVSGATTCTLPVSKHCHGYGPLQLQQPFWGDRESHLLSSNLGMYTATSQLQLVRPCGTNKKSEVVYPLERQLNPGK